MMASFRVAQARQKHAAALARSRLQQARRRREAEAALHAATMAAAARGDIAAVPTLLSPASAAATDSAGASRTGAGGGSGTGAAAGLEQGALSVAEIAQRAGRAMVESAGAAAHLAASPQSNTQLVRSQHFTLNPSLPMCNATVDIKNRSRISWVLVACGSGASSIS